MPNQPKLSGPELVLYQIQQGLNRLGYDAGQPDGRMGKRTRSAIRDYQRANKLRANGQASRALLDHINSNTRQLPSITRPKPSQPSNLPKPKILLNDNFRDGDYKNNPSWQLVAGYFRVEPTLGLRTYVRPPPRLPAVDQRPNISIQQSGQVTIQKPQTPLQTSTSAHGEIFLAETIPNRFVLDLQLSSRLGQGRIEFGVFQKRDRSNGYRLIYRPRVNISLLRLSRQPRFIASTEGPVNLEDGRLHNIRWTRRGNGAMSVDLDGRTLLQTKDRTFKNRFSGFSIVNRGGDYAIRSITMREAGN